jgi:hypothetical protein
MVHLSDWGHSFTRLFAVARSALWESINLLALLKSYGTASGRNLNGYRPYRKKVAIGIPLKNFSGQPRIRT